MDHPEQRILPRQTFEPPVYQHTHQAESGKHYQWQP
jgi:hypothetical protein